MRRYQTLLALFPVAALLALPALAQQDVITTLLGGGPNNIPALDAGIVFPDGVAADGAGNFYIASPNQNRVFKVDAGGTLTVLAGAGAFGYAGDGVPGGAANALLAQPSSVAVDTAGDVYIADSGNEAIRMVDGTGTITTILPSVYQPSVALDSAGNLYIAEYGWCQVQKMVLSTGAVSTIAGTEVCGYNGDGGPATSAELNYPDAVAADGAGNVYISDTHNFRIRQVNGSGTITTVAGNGTEGFSGDGGPAVSAEIGEAGGLAINGAAVLMADGYNGRVRQFTVGGDIQTVAGSSSGIFCGDGGPATSACLDPEDIAVGVAGNIYVADFYNLRVREFTIGGNIYTAAGDGAALATYPNGLPPQDTEVYPFSILVDPSRNIFVSNAYTNVVDFELGFYGYACSVIELVQSTALATPVAGTGVCGSSGVGRPATQAQIGPVAGLARDTSGNIYIGDTNNFIYLVDTSGVISTFAGTGECGYSGDGGPAANAALCGPLGLWADNQNNIYIADSSNGVIRKVTNGMIDTVAGIGRSGFSGDGGPAIAAELRSPSGVTTDGAGNLYIADTGNCRIREVVAASGTIQTVAGGENRPSPVCGFSGDGPATQNSLNKPTDVVADVNGNLFIADMLNQRLRWVDTSGVMHTFAGTGKGGFAGDGGPATNAEFLYPIGIAQDASGNFLVADSESFRVRGISAFAALNVSASSLAFGLVNVGSRSGPASLTLNAVEPVAIASISVSGDFSESNNCGSSLPNGQTCTIYVYSKPRAEGARTGALTIVDNGYFSGSATVSLSGTGSAVAIQGSPVNFGNQLAKTTSAPKKVTIVNEGTAAITMGAISLNETTDFAILSNTCPAPGQTLASGTSCVIRMTFTPQTLGPKQGVVTIDDSDPLSPQLVGLTGTGVSNVVFSPGSLTFGTQLIGTTSSPNTLTLTNQGATAITLGAPALSISGPFSSQSGTTCTNGLIVAAGGTCLVYVAFTPTATGANSGTLSVADSDATSPQTAALSGIGAAIQFSPSSLNFPPCRVGHKCSAQVSIVNLGTTEIQFTAAVILGPNKDDFNAGKRNVPCYGSVNPGGTCQFIFYFDPPVAGQASATYELYDDSPGSPHLLPLSGTGQ